MVEALAIHPSERPDVVGTNVPVTHWTYRKFQILSDQDGKRYAFHDILLEHLDKATQTLGALDEEERKTHIRSMHERVEQRESEKGPFQFPQLWAPRRLHDSIHQLAESEGLTFIALAKDLLADSLPQS